jgi:protein-tyrosine-phosphatase
MRHTTNKKYKKTRKYKKTKFRKTKNYKKTHKKTHKKGGMKRALTAFATIGLSLLGSVVDGANHYIMAVCAGNTCRSTMEQEKLIRILGREDYEIFSRGVSVRKPGAPMAPFSAALGIALCEGDLACQQRVEEHKSTQFDCQEVVNILRSNPLATFNIIPMDDNVANAIAVLMSKCDMTAEEKSRVKVGFCDEKSAAVPDPFKHQGTEHELDAYDETHGTIDNVTKRIAEKLINYEIQNPEGTFCSKRDLSSSSSLKAIYDENGNAKFVDENSDEFYKSLLYSSDINEYKI